MILESDLVILGNNLSIFRDFCISHLSGDDIHGLGHVKRVLRLAETICYQEKGDWVLTQVLVWLHDIGRKLENMLKKHHALISADLSDGFLRKLGVNEQTIQIIHQGIISHSFSIGGTPTYLEAQILSDADKLDALGSIGIYRACIFQYQHQQTIEDVISHFHEKLYKLPALLFLGSSKLLAEKKLQILYEFEKEYRN